MMICLADEGDDKDDAGWQQLALRMKRRRVQRLCALNEAAVVPTRQVLTAAGTSCFEDGAFPLHGPDGPYPVRVRYRTVRTYYRYAIRTSRR
jgi:hypothetical protein